MNNKVTIGLTLIILIVLAFSSLAGAQIEGPTYTPPPDSPDDIDLGLPVGVGPPGVDTPRTAGGPAVWQTALFGVLLLTAALPLMGRKH